MSYKKISLKTIAMMMAISIVCTSVPVYAEEIEEYIAEASDSENTSGGDSGSEVSGSLVITVEETSDSASGNTSEEVMNEVPDNEETVIEEPAIEETPGIENSEANDISIDTQVQTSGTSDISTETAVQNGEVYNQPFTDFIQGTENQYTKTIESFSTSESSNGRYNATFVLSEKNEQTGEIKTYNYTVSGFVSSEDASMYVNAMTSNPLASSQLMYSVESQNLVDAEKNPWKYDSNGNESPDDAYDSELCWAGTTSNMLELSGWNNAISSNTVNISNEDKIMDLYANVFTDAAGNPTYGLNWFFSGYYRAQEFDGWAHLKQDDYKGNGFLKEYCVDDFVKPENSITEDNLIGILNRLDVDGDGDRCALGMVFGYYTMDDNGQHIYDKNGEMNRDGGHVVTIVGYSTDENGIPTTITIADSDSYNDTFPGYSMGNDRTTYPNMYRTYPIKYYDGYWHIIN
ncbi:MAG: hypothetical protein Q4D29_13265, partial [Lachnospiraceae bacterium]|nr:hypothetical protein [Lachnospiraceae bacterium]